MSGEGGVQEERSCACRSESKTRASGDVNSCALRRCLTCRVERGLPSTARVGQRDMAFSWLASLPMSSPGEGQYCFLLRVCLCSGEFLPLKAQQESRAETHVTFCARCVPASLPKSAFTDLRVPCFSPTLLTLRGIHGSILLLVPGSLHVSFKFCS